ncbi:unnamed protein product [Lactuca virosa]|uniref:Uncharacterized protein n=1 Tax=Lactuca virosa TaxID=75947 RepID=A0AAU9M6J1_9ASTR|nr:unnamed protein product [Lactuca virosa]
METIVTHLLQQHQTIQNHHRLTTIKVAATGEVPTKEGPMGFIPPELNPNISSPIFAGSTDGLLRKGFMGFWLTNFLGFILDFLILGWSSLPSTSPVLDFNSQIRNQGREISL